MTKFEDLEFEFVADENGPGISVEWTVSCPKTVKGLKNSGGVNIKVMLWTHVSSFLLLAFTNEMKYIYVVMCNLTSRFARCVPRTPKSHILSTMKTILSYMFRNGLLKLATLSSKACPTKLGRRR